MNISNGKSSGIGKGYKFVIFFVTLCFTETFVHAQVDSVRQSVTLGCVEVKGTRYSSKAKMYADGKTVLDMQLLENLPKTLGYADPIHYSQMLPEIQTNGEYRAGINIQGCESSHNMVSIGSVPVYNPSHLLGFFSTFNASHYDRCTISRFANPKSANRLGGGLSMEVQSNHEDTISGVVSVGMISSEGTIRMPLGKKTSCKASFRRSYINLLCDRWMKNDNFGLGYSFYDMNLTLSHGFNKHHSLVMDYYGGNDNATFKIGSYTTRMNAKWGNQALGLHHTCDHKDVHIINSLYLTSYRNRFRLNMQELDIRLPSSILDAGIKHQATLNNLSWGADVIYHHIEPQSLQASGTFLPEQKSKHVSHTVENSAYVAYKYPFVEPFYLETGLRGNVYGSDETRFFASADPSITLTYNDYSLEVFAGYALKHQFLFQTGFSDVGLPTEFWLTSDKDFRPQYAHSFNTGISAYLLSRQYKASVNLFYKQLHHQMEYFGSILDLVNSEYKLKEHLFQGAGENYGFSFSLNKCSGNLTGWMSYTYTHAMRKFNIGNVVGTYPATHERPHELNAVLSYNIGTHWSVGSCVVAASGTPFTAVDYLALINGNVISHFKEHNSTRLRPYFRWDLSVNYKWKARFARENGINLSIYNLTGRDNELFYSVHVSSDGAISYRPKSFIVEVLPSISYFCKF